MQDIYMKLPRDGYETVLFQGIVSIISVNIIVPIIIMQASRFSWRNYDNLLPILPVMWLAVLFSIAIAQWPATRLKNHLVARHDSFNAQVTINILCHVVIISAMMTILSAWIRSGAIVTTPFRHFWFNWPHNFGIAFAVQLCISQPIARRILFYKHQHEDKWR